MTKNVKFIGIPGPYFIKVKIFLESGFKKNWASLSLGEFYKVTYLKLGPNCVTSQILKDLPHLSPLFM